jgi:hypothetical protein
MGSVGLASATTYNPTLTGVNIWNVPVDIYTQPNVDPYAGGALIKGCSTTWTIQACIRSYLQTWQNQGVTGVRFFIGIAAPLTMPASYFHDPNYSFVPSFTPGSPQSRDGDYSHPWVWNGSGPVIDTSNWQPNLLLFFADLKTYGMSASPSLGLDPGNAYLSSLEADCRGQVALKFLPWMPYGFTPDGYVDCKDINAAYSAYARNNPYFWGWSPFQSLVTAIVSSAYQVPGHLPLREFEIMQEQNFIAFTVEARMIYDNVHGFDVLQSVRNTLQSYYYSPALATFSTIPQFPDQDTGLNNQYGIDCGSVWGDSAMLLQASALTGAFAGPYGNLGWPSSYISSHLLACGGSTGGMEQLPVYHTQPSVLDVHAYPCINQTGQFTICSSSDATNTAETFYHDVEDTIYNRGLVSATFGESSIINYSSSCNLGGLPPSDTGAWWAVNGYKLSPLRNSSYAGSTVFQPFNDIQNSCYANPINITNSAYNPFN